MIELSEKRFLLKLLNNIKKGYGMSETKEELQHLVQTVDEEDNINEQDEQKILEEFEELDEYIKAPKSYEEEMAKTFSELPFKWRKYLHTREEEVDKGFSDLRERALMHKWIDEIYASRSDELQKNGVKSSDEWLKKMVEVDAMLSKNPTDTINMLAVSYGVGNDRKTSRSAESQSNLSETISKQLVDKQLNDFVNEVDEAGSLKHPFFKEVVKDMYDLISKGVAKDLKEAYETSIWLNSATRNKLIEKRTKDALEIKSKDAQKSKEAGFYPKGKAPENKKDLSLREELEMRFAELCNDF